MNAIEQLSAHDQHVVAECLAALLTGKFIDDAEFQVTAGVSFDQVRRVLDDFPQIDDEQEEVALVINGVLNDLVGYPHGMGRRWAEFISASPEEVAAVYLRWRALRGWC